MEWKNFSNFRANFWWSIKAMERSWIRIYTCCHTRYPISLCIVAEKQWMSSCYIISYHIISYHIISYHVISHHIISYHATIHQKSCLPSTHPPASAHPYLQIVSVHLHLKFPETNSSPLKCAGPQNRDGHLPTIHFQMHGKSNYFQ